LQAELTTLVAQLLGVKPEEVELEQSFEEYGLDPVQLSRLSERIQEKYGCELPLPLVSGQGAVTTIVEYLEKHHPNLSSLDVPNRGCVSLAELAYTLQIGREALESRLALVVADMADLRAKLHSYLTDSNDPDLAHIYHSHLTGQSQPLSLLTGSEEARDFLSALLRRGKLAELAGLWVSGVELDWSLLHGDEKPRRISLPVYPFEKKRYWIPETAQPENTVMDRRILSNASVSKGAAVHDERMASAERQSLPEPAPQSSQRLFVAESWLEQALPAQPANWVELLGRQAGKRLLVMYQQDSDYEAMRHLLENIGTILQEAPQASPLHYEFMKVTALETTGLAPWLQELKRENRLPQVIFHLAPPAKETDDRAELRFFFHLSQGLLREAGETSIQGYYLFETEASAPRLGLAALSGLTRSLALENPNHRYRPIAVDGPLNPGQKAVYLLNEWLLDNPAESLTPVSYQGLTRRVPVLQEIEPALTQPAPAFRQGAVYLITGGLGGLGQSLGDYLAGTYHNTLVILARSPLDQRQQQQIRQLESYGGQVYYFPVDITDRQALQQTIRQVKAKVGQINGVIHLARQVEDDLLLHKNFESFERVLSAKVEGTLVLDEATQNEPLEFFMLYSSLAAYGLKGSADYAYATAFQNSFARWRQAQVEAGRRSGQTRAICWGQWAIDRYSEAGRNGLLNQLGFELLTPETGLPLLEQSLLQKSVVVGAMAASDKGKLKRLLGVSSEAASQANSEALFEQLVLDLREGRRSREEVFRSLAKVDLNIFSDQQIDILYAYVPNGRDKTPQTRDDNGIRENGERVSASTNIRNLTLTKLKQTLKLENETIDPHKSFQDYGLDSITGMKLAVALQQALGVEVRPRWLIDYPTLDLLTEKMHEIKEMEGL
jgi:acyl carrier protein/NAD(P)-dependent dehydrogenase (short-subunit alcohol dehydrogenase family)